MSDLFFERPILNSPYKCPSKHWELDETGQPTQRIVEMSADVPNSFRRFRNRRKHKGSPLEQSAIVFDEAASKLGTEGQRYDLTEIINGVRITGRQMAEGCQIRNNGGCRLKRHDCSSIGGTIGSMTFGLSSARSKRWRPSSG